MATFLLLDNKDECTINTVAVTPVGTSGYIKFKMTYIYIMTVISTIVVLLGTKLIAGERYSIGGVSLFDNIGVLHIVSFAVVAALFTPTLALFQAAFAKNKIEGFALIKGTGMVAMVPLLMILEAFQGGLQYLLGIFPNFWAVKGLMLELLPTDNSANLGYPFYLLIGVIYNILVLMFAYRFFLKRVKY
jgi:fluoroquinolone transport system permease protein